MKKVDLEKMFEIGEELYAQEVELSGMSSIPYCWAKNNETGQIVIFAQFDKDAEEIMKRLKSML